MEETKESTENGALLKFLSDFAQSEPLDFTRGTADKDMENKQQRLIENMKSLRNLLPEKDALDASRDEMMINNIYDNYIKELENRKVGGVSRFISPEAIALCPYIEFPIDPMALGQRLGYSVPDLAAAIDQIVRAEELPKEPLRILEFLGFFLKQNVALQDGIPSNDASLEDQDELDDDDAKVLDDETPEEEEAPAAPVAPKPPPKEDKLGFSIAGDE